MSYKVLAIFLQHLIFVKKKQSPQSVNEEKDTYKRANNSFSERTINELKTFYVRNDCVHTGSFDMSKKKIGKYLIRAS